MTKLPRITGRKLLMALQKIGFEIIRSKGSHFFLRHPDGRSTVIPAHRGETLGPGITAQILKDCAITPEELTHLL